MNCLMAGVVLAYISTLRQKAAYRFRQFKDKVTKSMKMSSILGQFKESGELTGLAIFHSYFLQNSQVPVKLEYYSLYGYKVSGKMIY